MDLDDAVFFAERYGEPYPGETSLPKGYEVVDGLVLPRHATGQYCECPACGTPIDVEDSVSEIVEGRDFFINYDRVLWASQNAAGAKDNVTDTIVFAVGRLVSLRGAEEEWPGGKADKWIAFLAVAERAHQVLDSAVKVLQDLNAAMETQDMREILTTMSSLHELIGSWIECDKLMTDLLPK